MRSVGAGRGGGEIQGATYRAGVVERDPESSETPPTLLQRMVAAKISEDRAREYLRTQWVSGDGEVITDPDAVVAKFVIKPPPVTEHV